MAKAHITAPGGVEINIEGTPEEIAAVLKQVGLKSSNSAKPAKETKRVHTRATIPTLVDELKEEGFFKKPKGLDDIRRRLADLGHNYPVTTLSGAMQAQAKKRVLRRFKEGGKYVYAQ
jgi:hypothetical protein